jgi:UDP-N-acetylglucosamine:LPS N-acetylglucosamine transferase
MRHRASLLNRRAVPARGLSCEIVSAGGRSHRVLLLTAPVGEGHVAAARVLADDLLRRNPGAQVTVRDVLPELAAPLRWLLNDAYRWQLRSAPWLFGLLYGTLRRSRLLRWLARALLSLTGSRAVLRLVRRHRPDVVVSTWPPATLMLGSLRLRGKVLVPACATITDFAGLELWADKGIDLHLVMHESLVPGVERLAGRGSAQPVSPLVGPEFHAPRVSVEARRALGLPSERTVVVVSGGGWGVGDLAGAVNTALELDATVVCLAGRDPTTRTRLEIAFAAEPRVRVLGFTDSMSDLLAAANVLVHSTGGVTCLEALARDCPVVAYGAPPGHAPLLAREMASLGLLVHARSASELKAALLGAECKSRVTLSRSVDAASLVLAAMPRVAVRTRARFARTFASTAALALVFFTFLASDATYPVVAEALAFPESTSIVSPNDDVALVVRGQPRGLLALAAVARKNHLHASVAADEPLSDRDVAIIRAAGLDPMPELSSRGVRSWFSAHGQLESQRARYGLSGSFPYLAPHEGFTIPDYLLARHLGGALVQAGYELPARVSPGAVHSGEVVVATLGADPGHDTAHLLTSIRRIERSGLGVSSVQRLSGRGLSR